MNKTRRRCISIGILSFLGSACGQANEPARDPGGVGLPGQQAAAYERLETYDSAGAGAAVSLGMREIRDPRTGMVNMYMPLPADWRLTDKGIEGPGGTLVQELPGASFTGQQRHIQSIDDIVQQDIAQLIQHNGAEYRGSTDLPAVAQRDQRLGLQEMGVDFFPVGASR